MKAVVMAGGEGSRLRPLTIHRPKPLVPVGNRPLMEHILRHLAAHGFREILATVHYLADEIEAQFGDGSDLGLQLTYVLEDSPLGTAGSIGHAAPLLRGDEPFLIVSGDALTDCDFSAAIKFHREKGATATLVLARVPDPQEFGIVVSAPDGRVERFLEKPEWSSVFTDTVNTGIYIVEPAVLDRIAPDLPCDWSKDVFPAMLAEGAPLFAYVMEGYWADVGTLEQYRQAQCDFLDGFIKVGDHRDGAAISARHCRIDEMATIVEPVIIGQNVKIKRNATVGPYAILGDNCLIEEEARVAQSVLWESVYVGGGAVIEGAVVGTRANVKKDARVHSGAIIGDRATLDVGATVRPNVKVWPDKVVERGGVVTSSLVYAARWRGSLFRDLGLAGVSNVEMTPDVACRLGSAFGSIFPNGARIVTSRDGTRSSRMIKRAIIASLLSVGCDVLDLRSAPVPVARHFMSTGSAAAMINVRKLPSNRRVTLIEMFGPHGEYLRRVLMRKVESTYHREEFKRIDSDDLGQINFASRAGEEYTEDYFKHLTELDVVSRLRVVCDYAYGPLANTLPSMLDRMGIDSIALNGFSDTRRAPRTHEEIESHTRNLQHIVRTLDYDLGVLFLQDGERLILVDQMGGVHAGINLLALFTQLVLPLSRENGVVLPATAPLSLAEYLTAKDVRVLTARIDLRSLEDEAAAVGIALGGDRDGGFMFPRFHPGFDAAFAFGEVATALRRSRVKLHEVAAEIPDFPTATGFVQVPWDRKGETMRRISETWPNARVCESIDGLRLRTVDAEIYIVPDSLEPQIHLFSESDTAAGCHAAIDTVAEFIRHLIQ
jgi:mannose-1-phosphate guanylyltransferase/phosphomannomutase